MRQQSDFRGHAQLAHFTGRHQGNGCQLFRSGINIDMGVDQKYLASRQNQTAHRAIDLGAFFMANHLINVFEVG